MLLVKIRSRGQMQMSEEKAEPQDAEFVEQ